MTRKDINRAAFDATHKALLLKVRHSRGLARVRALNELKAHMVQRLANGK